MNTEPTDYTKLPVVTFIDNVARLIVGALAEETEDTLSVYGPAVIDIVAGQAPGTFGIRIVPVILTELLEDAAARPKLSYSKASITPSNAALQNEIIGNYRKTITPPSLIVTPTEPAIVPAAPLVRKDMF